MMILLRETVVVFPRLTAILHKYVMTDLIISIQMLYMAYVFENKHDEYCTNPDTYDDSMFYTAEKTMKHFLCIFLVCVCVSSCTVYTGPIKLARIGGKEERSGKTVKPPETTGEIKLDFAGTFGDDAGIRSPWGISFGVDGTLYVCDRDRSSVVRIGSDGSAAARYSGTGTRVERLYSPIDICSSAGMAIYAIDAADSRILRFDRNLKNSFVIFRKDTENNRLFGTFNGLAFDKISGDLFVTDRDTGSLIRIDMLGGSVSNRGSFGSSKESFREPAGLDVSQDGVIYVADKGDSTIAVLEHFGARIRHIGRDIVRQPADVTVIPEIGIAVADSYGIVVLSHEGIALGTAGYGVDRKIAPRSVAVRENKLYISDGLSGKILVYRIEKTQ